MNKLKNPQHTATVPEHSPWRHTQVDGSHKQGHPLPPDPQLTFAVGEVIGTWHAHITMKSRHSGPAATLPGCGVTGGVQGTISRAVAGCGGAVSVRVQDRAVNGPPPLSQETHGCSWGSCGSQGCTPGKRCLCSRDGSGMTRPLHSVDPGPPEGHRHKLWAHRVG